MSRWRVKVLFDGACPLCRREAGLWRRLDGGRGRIALEDISAPDFDPSRYGLTRDEVLNEIHGILPSGEVVRGMETIRRAYQALGLGWLTAPTAWPGLKPVFDSGYHWFSRNRLRVTGRVLACDENCRVDHWAQPQRSNMRLKKKLRRRGPFCRRPVS